MLASNIAIQNEGHGEPLVAPGYLLQFSLVTSLFFMWGVPNNLNDVLIRQFMKSFALSRVEAGLIQSAFYLGYFFLAIPAALIMRRTGYKTGLITGLLLFATGAALFWPAAIVGKYWFFLAALFVIASGLSFLETASNPFITQMGSPATAARRLNFSQAFNPLGAITGVLAGTVFIFSGVELNASQIAAQKAAGTYAAYLQQETMRVVAPYLALALIALTLAVVFMRTRFPEVAAESGRASIAGGARRHPRTLAPPALCRGCLCAVPLRRSTGRHLELLHPVCAGVHASAGKACRAVPDRDARRIRRRPLLCAHTC